jgi:hypothetical protein
MKGNQIIGYSFQVLFISLILVLSYIGERIFFIFSILFLFAGGFYEFVIMNNFKGTGKENPSKCGTFKSSFLWVHQNVDFIKRFGKTIYSYDKTSKYIFCSYLIFFLYVLVAFILYRFLYLYSILIYLFPVLTNLYSFFRNRYSIIKTL